MTADFDSLELKLAALLGDAPPLPEPPPEMVGEVVGDTYEILRELGEGGMGQVFVARHARTGGEVAIKLIRPKHVNEDDFIARFELEAKNTAALNHPNIVKVFDYGVDDGLAYIAMELAAGRSVGELLDERHVLKHEDATAICGHTLRALQVAHDTGLVHRDIKPDNILATYDGDSWFVKVLDFGIAHAFEAERVGPQSVIGSPHSMAPEQFQADGEITPRADLYALGCTVFAMLTGYPPFHGTFWELAVFHAEQEPPPLDDVPEPLADWVYWLLAKSPDDRPESAQVALDALLEVERGHRASPVVASHLPHVLTSFVGRETELAALDEHLANRARLVTLAGIGGLGKTRLSLEWGQQNARLFTGGAYFADLAETRTVEGICIAVAQALDASLGDGDPAEAVGRILVGRGRTLIILDNFEQIVAHAPSTVGAWLRAAADTTFVVTSRHRLGLQDEQVVDVSPLPTDDENAEGVQLFVERATQARADFAPDDDGRAAIREIVEQLDGLPLAIEMAAARVRSMTPATILDRLGERFRLLRSSRRDISDRQLTMRAALDWSWDLLDAAEKSALRQAAVFAGSFDLDASEAVLDLTDEGDPWVVDVLESLVDKSLLRTRDDGRFSMFVSVNDYAREKLLEAGDEAARDRHLAHFARLGDEQSVNALVRDRRVVETFELELENLHVAAEHGERNDERRGALCAIALGEYFHFRGPLAPGIEVGRRLLWVATDDSLERRRLLGTLGLLLMRQGNFVESKALLREALELAERLGDQAGTAQASVHLGYMHVQENDLVAAQQMLWAGLEAAIAAEDRGYEALARFFIGSALRSTGDGAGSHEFMHEALSIAVELGAKRLEGWIRRSLSVSLRMQGELDLAFENARRSLDLAVDIGDRFAEAWSLLMLGALLSYAGELAAAVAHFESAMKIAEELGDDLLLPHALRSLASMLQELGRPEAVALTERCLEVTREHGNPHMRMQALSSRAHNLITRGELQRADALLTECRELAEQHEQKLELAEIVCLRARMEKHPIGLIDELREVVEAGAMGNDDRALAAALPLVRAYLGNGQNHLALETVQYAQSLIKDGVYPPLVMESLCVRALVLAAHNRHDEALTLLDRAAAKCEDFGLPSHAPMVVMVAETRGEIEA